MVGSFFDSENKVQANHQAQLSSSHSFGWRMLCGARSAAGRGVLEGLLIQQWNASYRQVYCFIAKFFPSGIT